MVSACTARCPASSANLGPGFDTLALALARYVEVHVEAADALVITAEGHGAERPPTPDHLAAAVVRHVLGHDRVRIHVRSEIPLARGLGSSASLAAAAAAAAGAEDVLGVATHFDGHPENAAAAILGGLVVATMIEGRPVARRLGLDPELAFVVVIPDMELATKTARGVLPSKIPHGDAGFNLGRMGLLIGGLADHRKLIPAAAEDRLHQSYRAALYPQSGPIMEGLIRAGALASCWSGAGPALLAMTHWSCAKRVRDAAEALMVEAGMAGTAEVMEADRHGLIVSR